MFDKNNPIKGFPFFEEFEWDFEGHFGNKKVDMKKKDKEYEILFELAGFDEDDIKIELDKERNMIKIEAEKSSEDEHSMIESKVKRTMRIPKDAKLEDGLEATYNNGLISIKVQREDTQDIEEVEIKIK